MFGQSYTQRDWSILADLELPIELLFVLHNSPNCVNAARKPAQKCQQHIDDECGTKSKCQEDSQGRNENGKKNA